MEKKEKKSDLEWLLNSLIEKGYRPFWKKADHCLGCRYNNDWSEMYKYVGFWWWDDVVVDRKVPLRNLVSAESWLWQFCCKNRFLKWPDATDDRQKNAQANWLYDKLYYASEWQYYIIESALKDESELEDFLLSNIKGD